MTEGARRIILPRFALMELASGFEEGATKRYLPDGSAYYTKNKFVEGISERIDGEPAWLGAEFDRFPIVVKGNGEPWYEVNVWILMQLEGRPSPNMETFLGIAEDMTAYLRFLEEHNLDWLTFEKFKLRRPTYRYNGHLRARLHMGEISIVTAKRRISRVVNFYRSMISSRLIQLNYPPWEEKEVFVGTINEYGKSSAKKVITTDLNIKVSKQVNPFDETINDGGKLRPLTLEEQAWLREALLACDHTETMLIHAVSLATGARIQTVLTLRLKTILPEIKGDGLVRIPAGPHRGKNTGIDTKNNKSIILQFPPWLYQSLQTYAHSARARARRKKAPGGDHPDQYLFLSPNGAPLYVSRQDQHYGDGMRRHQKRGQTVRAYIQKYILPYIRMKYSPTFTYRFHDLRATFGMNLMDSYREKIDKGEVTYTAALNIIAGRMCHASPTITERYFNYRDRLKLAHAGQDGWEKELQFMAKMAAKET